jgi:glutamate synthase domain-containing protein 2
MMHNALVGTGLRDRVKIGASGKVATGAHIVMRLIQGADYTNAARAMMMAVGCIQAQLCHTDKCPVGVATQDTRRARAVDVEDKSQRVLHYQQGTVAEAVKMMASMGARDPRELSPTQLRKVVNAWETRSYAELFEWLAPGQLVDEPPATWAADWAAADPTTFRPRRSTTTRS